MRRRVAFLASLFALACGPGNPGGPNMNNRMSSEQPGPDIQSNDILSRDAQANRTAVKHILIGWRDLERSGEIDARARTRTRQQADQLAESLLERVRKGEPIEPLMAEFSEDGGSAESGDSYEVTPDAKLVFEFKRLGLRLKPGEAGLVMSQFGWHVMKRVE
ncbi:MAG TPA: peptidylprolyl isomerase [Kofleriaceae bacterium]|nr:peptidylprolyl isomerase [Kofleriaceae bacterium]